MKTTNNLLTVGAVQVDPAAIAQAIIQNIFCTPPTSEDQPSAPVIRAGQTLGTITCIQGGDGLRWFGRKHESPVTGNGHPTPEQAIQDVVDWADGKEVKYTKHCQGCVGKEVCGG